MLIAQSSKLINRLRRYEQQTPLGIGQLKGKTVSSKFFYRVVETFRPCTFVPDYCFLQACAAERELTPHYLLKKLISFELSDSLWESPIKICEADRPALNFEQNLCVPFYWPSDF